MFRILASAIFVTLVVPQNASPDRQNDPLRGIDTVSVAVEELSPDAAKCNVRSEPIELAAARPLLDGKIRVDAKAPTYVYINVAAVADDRDCAAAVMISARTIVAILLPFRPADKVAVQVLLWDDGRILTGSRAGFNERVIASVRDLVDRFVTKVKLANQR